MSKGTSKVKETLAIKITKKLKKAIVDTAKAQNRSITQQVTHMLTKILGEENKPCPN